MKWIHSDVLTTTLMSLRCCDSKGLSEAKNSDGLMRHKEVGATQLLRCLAQVFNHTSKSLTTKRTKRVQLEFKVHYFQAESNSEDYWAYWAIIWISIFRASALLVSHSFIYSYIYSWPLSCLSKIPIQHLKSGNHLIYLLQFRCQIWSPRYTSVLPT